MKGMNWYLRSPMLLIYAFAVLVGSAHSVSYGWTKLNAVRFKPGHPLPGESVSQALSDKD